MWGVSVGSVIGEWGVSVRSVLGESSWVSVIGHVCEVHRLECGMWCVRVQLACSST